MELILLWRRLAPSLLQANTVELSNSFQKKNILPQPLLTKEDLCIYRRHTRIFLIDFPKP